MSVGSNEVHVHGGMCLAAVVSMMAVIAYCVHPFQWSLDINQIYLGMDMTSWSPHCSNVLPWLLYMSNINGIVPAHIIVSRKSITFFHQRHYLTALTLS